MIYRLAGSLEDPMAVLASGQVDEVAEAERVKEDREGVDEGRLLVAVEHDLVRGRVAEHGEEVAHGLVEALLRAGRVLRRVHEAHRLEQHCAQQLALVHLVGVRSWRCRRRRGWAFIKQVFTVTRLYA